MFCAYCYFRGMRDKPAISIFNGAALCENHMREITKLHTGSNYGKETQ